MKNDSAAPRYSDTPNGRYFVVRVRLWRKSNPALADETRQQLVKQLMSARLAVRDRKGNADAIADARAGVDDAKGRSASTDPSGGLLAKTISIGI